MAQLALRKDDEPVDSKLHQDFDRDSHRRIPSIEQVISIAAIGDIHIVGFIPVIRILNMMRLKPAPLSAVLTTTPSTLYLITQILPELRPEKLTIRLLCLSHATIFQLNINSVKPFVDVFLYRGCCG